MTKRRRSIRVFPSVEPDEARAAILGFANVVAGCADFLGEIAKGTSSDVAAKRAVRRGRARAKALRDAERATRGLDGPEDES